jgi:hypothetical protein
MLQGKGNGHDNTRSLTLSNKQHRRRPRLTKKIYKTRGKGGVEIKRSDN